MARHFTNIALRRSVMLTVHEAADYLRLSERTLERMRVTGFGPNFVKVGRSVHYRQSDLDAWIASRVIKSTSEVENERSQKGILQ
jgi:excisionase family DNA binding protein